MPENVMIDRAALDASNSFNRAAFFSGCSKLFDGYKTQLGQWQIVGLDFFLDTWLSTYRKRTSIPQAAYMLATEYHETAAHMQPIKEIGGPAYFTRMYDISGARPGVARMLGNVYPGDGAKFPGMGYVQSTGRTNAKRNTLKLRAMGIIGDDVDFEKTPELMMEPRYAIHIMFAGMEEGWFTGRKLDDIIDDRIDGDENADFIRGRVIINGTDKSDMIASEGMVFLRALQNAFTA